MRFDPRLEPLTTRIASKIADLLDKSEPEFSDVDCLQAFALASASVITALDQGITVQDAIALYKITLDHAFQSLNIPCNCSKCIAERTLKGVTI